MSLFMVSHGGETRFATAENWNEICEGLIAKHGPGVPKIEEVAQEETPAAPEAVSALAPADDKAAYSDFGAGNQHMDDAARARIHAQHAALEGAGVKVEAGQQLFSTGTRMARSGYAAQAARKAEHENKSSLERAAEQLRSIIQGENRQDHEVSSTDLASKVAVNGRITIDGYLLGEQAMRALFGRIRSPASSYVFGIRDRIVAELSKPEDERDRHRIAADKAKIADVLSYELARMPETALKLRVRNATQDIYAVVSPSYVPADAPEAIDHILLGAPRDSRGSYAYDPASTSWELRAEVWTPTPVEEQAVGEPFEGYVSFQSRDNGTGSLRGGGGISLIRCLNASTYAAASADASRRHVGRILYDVPAMVGASLRAIAALCDAWGASRKEEVAAPSGVPINEAIPGFWRHLLADRRSELAGVLPGRTENHVAALSATFATERRDEAKLVRADFAQAWTRHIQTFPTPVRRDAERAIAAWMVEARPKMVCDLRAE